MAPKKKSKAKTRSSKDRPRFLAIAIGSFANMIAVVVTTGTVWVFFYAAKRLL
jgi:hypothetical protein